MNCSICLKSDNTVEHYLHFWTNTNTMQYSHPKQKFQYNSNTNINSEYLYKHLMPSSQTMKIKQCILMQWKTTSGLIHLGAMININID
jgi:hypothetical protein